MITSSLRYLLVSKNPSLATEDDEKPASLTLIGSNPRTASTMIIELPLNLLRRPAPKGGRVRLWRYRPTIDIGQIVRSTDARSFLSISKLSPHYSEQELIFWQARQQQSEVLRVTPTTSICLNAPSNFARDVAAWTDGFALVSQKGKVGIWQLRRGKKSRLEHSQELHLDSSRAKQIACLSQLEENTLFALTEEHEIAVWRSSIEGKFSTRPVRSVSIAPHSNLSSTLQLSTSVLNHSCGELLISSLAPDGITTPRKLIHKRQDVLTTAVFGDYIALGNSPLLLLTLEHDDLNCLR